MIPARGIYCASVYPSSLGELGCQLAVVTAANSGAGSMDNVARQKLKRIIATFGVTVCNDIDRCRGLLCDSYPTGKLEIHVLVNALAQRVPQDLLSRAGNLPLDVIASQLTQRLVENYGTTFAAAQWAVESWMFALSMITEAELDKSRVAAADQVHSPPAMRQARPSRSRVPIALAVLLLASVTAFGIWYAAPKAKGTSDPSQDPPKAPVVLKETPDKPDKVPAPKPSVQPSAQSWTDDTARLQARILEYLRSGTLLPSGSESDPDHKLAKRIYNSLMAAIEPDLVLANIGALDQKYPKFPSETAEQHMNRMQKYEQAFKQLESRLPAYRLSVGSHRKKLSKLREFLQFEDLEKVTATTVVDGMEIGKWVEEARSEKRKNGLKDHPWLVADLETIPGWTWESRQ